MAGRKTKLGDVLLLPDGQGGQTPRIRWEVIVERVRAGIPNEVAAESTGIDQATFYRWIAWGEDRWENGKLRHARPGYREFSEAVRRARAEAEALHVGIIAKAAPEDWRASAFFLERSRPERWRRRDTIHQAGPGDGDPAVPATRVVHDIDPGAGSKLGDLLDLVAAAGGRRGAEPPTEGGDGGSP